MDTKAFRIGDRVYDSIDVYTIIELNRREVRLTGDKKIYRMPIYQLLYLLKTKEMHLEN